MRCEAWRRDATANNRERKRYMESVLIPLLYVTCILVHCANNNNNNNTQSNEEFIRKCCFHGIDVIDDRENRCNVQSLNDTFTVASNSSFDNAFDAFCCSLCSENLFELEVDPKQMANEHQRAIIEETLNFRGFCFKICRYSDETIETWKERNEDNPNDHSKDDPNDSSVRRSNRTGENKDEIEKEKETEKGKEKENDNDDDNEKEEKWLWRCDSVFTSLNFWGANMVVFANIIYIVPYVIVVVVYFAVLRKSTRAYHKAVLFYNLTQIFLNVILIGIGACVLCHVSIYTNVYAILGLTIMFLTISSTCWLFVICIDMTLVITRFRRTSAINASQEEEKYKFVKYAGCTWGGSLLVTVVAAIAELSPLLPISSPAKPNFSQFNDGANLAVILYVTTIPALTCLANTLLFCYTSYKMILIRKSTTLATENSSLKMNTVKRRYIIFLKLYLLMDAPWVTSALAAAFTDLWLLKFLRMIQPILMLCAILPPGSMARVFAFPFPFPFPFPFASIRRLLSKPKATFETDQTP